MFGFHRIAVARPETVVADTARCLESVERLAEAADSQDASIVLFPELALTGASCGDLFHSSTLLDHAEHALSSLAEFSGKLGVVIVAGLPLRRNGKLYSCAAVVHRGRVLGVVPKSFIANRREYYERRWFAPGRDLRGTVSIRGATAPFGDDLVFERNACFAFGIDICEDLWTVDPPSSKHAMAGATILLNPSASDELVAKAAYRRDLVSAQSARCVAAYAYSSSGVGESTADMVFGGHGIVAENGSLLAESNRFEFGEGVFYADVDCAKLANIRMAETSFDQHPHIERRRIRLDELNAISKIERSFHPRPFVPGDPDTMEERCLEIVSIQKTALARRLDAAKAEKAVIGVSGGLDSTLALLVSVEALEILGRPSSDVLSVTMPGFGTTKGTKNNAVELCRILGVELLEIDIKPACARHFEDIGHDSGVLDTTYENVQARERTQILMDLANKRHGIVVGTGDLSESALGWSTYNGDHMSMYAVNCGVPKTLVKHLVAWFADSRGGKLAEILGSVLDTPVSPELLPAAADGSVAQKTEEIIGPYELHDFFLYHFVKHGAPPDKLLALAEIAFDGALPSEEIEKHLETFLKRFFGNQFKRDCVPNGPKVGTIALSPRGDWRMPSDASPETWLGQLRSSGKQ